MADSSWLKANCIVHYVDINYPLHQAPPSSGSMLLRSTLPRSFTTAQADDCQNVARNREEKIRQVDGSNRGRGGIATVVVEP